MFLAKGQVQIFLALLSNFVTFPFYFACYEKFVYSKKFPFLKFQCVGKKTGTAIFLGKLFDWILNLLVCSTRTVQRSSLWCSPKLPGSFKALFQTIAGSSVTWGQHMRRREKRNVQSYRSYSINNPVLGVKWQVLYPDDYVLKFVSLSNCAMCSVKVLFS